MKFEVLEAPLYFFKCIFCLHSKLDSVAIWGCLICTGALFFIREAAETSSSALLFLKLYHLYGD